MNIIMESGLEPTEEVKKAVSGYNPYFRYIDSSTDMHLAIDRNNEIKESFKDLGIKEIRE